MKVKTKDITLIGMMIAIVEVCKVVFAGIPNVELTSFWIVVFTICFGKKMFYTIPAFILIEGMMYGFGIWWVQYLIAWPVLGIAAMRLRNVDSALGWAIISGMFGLFFGVLCAIPYLFMGGVKTAVAWWIAGIPWDLVHGAANFVIMLILYHPIMRVMKVMQKNGLNE
jgi:energy-coupling factor transport system substrate-specific component